MRHCVKTVPLLLVLVSACASVAVRRDPAALVLPFPADTMRARVVTPGVVHRFIYASSGPWAIHVLDVNRESCFSAVAVKPGAGASGREKTSEQLASLDKTAEVIGGVNADFFLFAPAGVPTNAHISRGRVVTGPNTQPVLAFDSLGAPRITTLRANGSLAIGGARFEINNWNRRAVGLALFDASWGDATDTASSVVEVVMEGSSPSRVVRVDTTPAGVAIPAGGAVLVARGGGDTSRARAALLSLNVADTLRAAVTLAPFVPREAVGGRPVLVRDSAISAAVDTEGAPGFAAGRHPRTAVGIAGNGKRLLLVVVDGRQKPYSDGMTLRELATVMLALGARDAINLDGGGSTTLVAADPDSTGALRVLNRPSDPTGERPVGNALAIVRGCAR
ncbi:MAG: phosphodiester glycosidase family protein [Gemmatimonadaceae bacterium]